MSNIARPIFNAAEGEVTLSSAAGGATAKSEVRSEYQLAYKRSVAEAVDKVNLSIKYANSDNPAAVVCFDEGPHSASGRLRLTELHHPFIIGITGSSLVLMYCSIQTYLPDRTAIGGKYFLVADRSIADHLVSLTDPNADTNQAGKIKPILCNFVSGHGFIDDVPITDIFKVTELLG